MMPIRVNIIGPTEISHQHQRLDCGLPFRLGRFLLRQPGNAGRGGVQRVSTYFFLFSPRGTISFNLSMRV